MRAEAIPPTRLPRFLATNLTTSFKLYMHILSEPFLSTLCSLEPPVKKTSKIFLDENKELNKRAARRLLDCGYTWVYFVPRLHAKLLVADKFVVIGSANYSSRAVEDNYEVIIVIWARPREIIGLEKVLRDVEVRATPWRSILR